MKTSFLRAALSALLFLQSVSLSAQATAVRQQVRSAPTTLMLIVELQGDRARVLSAHPKETPYVPRVVHGDDRLRLRLRDAGGRTLATVHVPVPRFSSSGADTVHGVGRPPASRERGAFAGALFVKVPDLGMAVSNLLIERETAGAVRQLGFASGSLLRTPVPESNVTVKTVRGSGFPSNRLDLVILAEAYQGSEESVFDADVQTLLNDMFQNLEPFKTYANYFNVHTVFRPCMTGDPCAPASQLNYGARLCSGGLLNILSGSGLQTMLTDAVAGPDVDQGAVLILINTQQDPDLYGGIAEFDFYGISTTNRIPPVGGTVDFVFPNIAEHELGHSIGFLGDEYDDRDPFSTSRYSGPEVPFANLTVSDISKWSHWALPFNPIPGGLGFDTGIFHTEPACMMNLLTPAFCTVSREALVKRFYTVPGIRAVDWVLPGDPAVTLEPTDTQTFRIQQLAPPGAKIDWLIDGVLQSAAPLGNSITLSGGSLSLGSHTVEVRVEDRARTIPNSAGSSMVRRDDDDVLHFSFTWNVESVLPQEDLRLHFIRNSVTSPSGTYGGDIGRDLVGVGDVDGDGADDFAFRDLTGPCVVSGRSGDQLWRSSVNGVGPMARIGDLDGDGHPEIGVSRSGNQLTILSSVDGTVLRTLSPPAPTHEPFGRSVCGLSDIDGDGIDEYVVSHRTNPPRVYVRNGSDDSLLATYVHSSYSPFINLASMGDALFAVQWSTGVEVHGALGGMPLATMSGSGERLLEAADLDGDAVAELIVAGTSGNGLVRVLDFDGQSGVLQERFRRSGLSGLRFGSSIAGAGDFNMDGIGDVIVGAPGVGSTAQSVGSVGYVEVLSGLNGGSITIRSAPDVGQLYGFDVANVGDVNDDGIDDIGVTQGGGYRASPDHISSVHVYTPVEPSLWASESTVSTTDGGVIDLSIDTPDTFGNQLYIVLGSASGTRPGRIFGARRLPLQSDWYFDLMANSANTAMFVNTFGTLDAAGQATASIAIPPLLLAPLVGVELHHAVLVTPSDLPSASWTTNAVRLVFTQ